MDLPLDTPAILAAIIVGAALLLLAVLVVRRGSGPRDIGGSTPSATAPVAAEARHPGTPEIEPPSGALLSTEPGSAAPIVAPTLPSPPIPLVHTAATVLQLSPEIVRAGEQEVRDLAAAGEKLEAIRRVRELTGAELKIARDYVERLPNAPPLTGLLPPSLDIDPVLLEELAALIDHGQKLEAVALCRERTGLDLRQAKAVVDSINIATR